MSVWSSTILIGFLMLSIVARVKAQEANSPEYDNMWARPCEEDSVQGIKCKTLNDENGICTKFCGKYTSVRYELICCPDATSVTLPEEPIWEIIKPFDYPNSIKDSSESLSLLLPPLNDQVEPNTEQTTGECKTKEGGNGICTLFSMCNDNGKKSIKYKNVDRCYFIGEEEFICCPLEDPAPSTKPTTDETSTEQTTGECKTKEGGNGICTLFSTCSDDGKKSIEYKNVDRCYFIGEEEFICCPLKGPAPSTKPTIDQTITEQTTGGCKTKEGGNGICTLFSTCSDDGKKSIEYKNVDRCYFIGEEEFICCPLEDPAPSTKPTTDETSTEQTTGECKTKEGGNGICTLFSTCSDDGKKSIEYKNVDRCYFIGEEEFICCPLKGPAPSTKPTIDQTILIETLGPVWGSSSPATIDVDPSSTTEENATISPTEQTTLGYPEPSTKPTSLPVPKGTSFPNPTIVTPNTFPRIQLRRSQVACEKYHKNQSNSPVFHILQGKNDSKHTFPHVGRLIFEDTSIRCGSSLISDRYALTAAHCVYKKDSAPISIQFGSIEWNNTSNNNGSITVTIESIILYPNFNSTNKEIHDIALIKLSKSIKFTDFICPACLNSDVKDFDSEVQLYISGWGVAENASQGSDSLLMANITTFPLEECKIIHQPRHIVNQMHYCAFDNKTDACEGDSGGPLQLLLKNNDSLIVGIISFGEGCGGPFPAVYTRVAYYLDWIESVVWPSS